MQDLYTVYSLVTTPPAPTGGTHFLHEILQRPHEPNRRLHSVVPLKDGAFLVIHEITPPPMPKPRLRLRWPFRLPFVRL